MTYASRLADVTASRGRLCVGLDPQPSVLAAWGLERGLAAVERVTMTMIEALGDTVAAFKPQSAFYEAYGSAGIGVLERALRAIRDVGAVSILDVKRGDIGSSMAGYADAYLAPDAPLRADAITLSPYLGFDSLRPAIEQAIASDRGVYVLARTSNPESAPVQLATTTAGVVVAQSIVDAAQQVNAEHGSPVGLVVGATHADIGVDLASFSGSVLVPGIGAQGGRVADLARSFGAAARHVLPTASRQVLNVGDDRPALRAEVSKLLSEIAELDEL